MIIVNDDEIKLGSVLEEGLLVSGGDDLGGFNLKRVDAKMGISAQRPEETARASLFSLQNARF